MKEVKFVSVRHKATRRSWDVPLDLYEMKKASLDQEYQEWECNEIPFNKQVPDNYESVSEKLEAAMNAGHYEPEAPTYSFNGIAYATEAEMKEAMNAAAKADSGEQKFEFDGKEYKTEAAMKAAMTKAAKISA